MKSLIIAAVLLVAFASCEKDKYTTAPQIEFKRLSHNLVNSETFDPNPDIIFGITDKEGDIGLKAGTDTAYIYMKNVLTGKADSLPFPDLEAAGKSNFNAEVTANINVLQCLPIPGGGLHTDTLYFEVYVTDFAGNKSNVITTSDPVFFICR